jgi:formamidopyrimidine-DNA glycosylase
MNSDRCQKIKDLAISKVTRRGKYIVIHLSHDVTLLIHQRLKSGRSANYGWHKTILSKYGEATAFDDITVA